MQAAELLGISRTTLRAKLKTLGLSVSTQVVIGTSLSDTAVDD